MSDGAGWRQPRSIAHGVAFLIETPIRMLYQLNWIVWRRTGYTRAFHSNFATQFLRKYPLKMKKHGINKGNSSDNPDRVRKNSNMRDRSTINRIHMYREGKAKHDRDGKVIGGYLRSTDKTANQVIDGPARIAPNRKWFGNTRTITPEKLDTFREEMAKTVNDPYILPLWRGD